MPSENPTAHSTEVATKLVEADVLLQASVDLLSILSPGEVSSGMRKRLRQQLSKLDMSLRQIRDALGNGLADDLESSRSPD